MIGSLEPRLLRQGKIDRPALLKTARERTVTGADATSPFEQRVRFAVMSEVAPTGGRGMRDWFSNGLLWRQSDVQSALQCRREHSSLARYLRQRRSDTIDCHSAIVAPVIVLDFVRGPSNISGFVMPVCVDAVERVTRRTLAHVGQKIRKRVSPALAHLNAAGTIRGVAGVTRVVTATFRAVPRVVRRGDATVRSRVHAVAVRQLWTRARQFTATAKPRIARVAETARVVWALGMAGRGFHRVILNHDALTGGT